MSAPAIDAPDQAVILVGGLGTRLGELTEHVPKPLLPVGGRPFLDYLLENCIRFGFKNILLLAGFKAESVSRYVEDARGRFSPELDLRVLIEPSPRGTAGALRYAATELSERFLLLNGDSFLNTNWLDLMVPLANADPTVVMALRHVDDTSRYGVVRVESDSVVGMDERGQGGAGLINAGVYLCHRRILDTLPESGSLEREVLPTLCELGKVMGRLHSGFFLDIGLPEAFASAQILLPQQRRRPAVFFDRDGTLNVDYGYTHRVGDLAFMPGAIAAVKNVNDRGYFAFVVTNQAGIAKGLFTEFDLLRFNDDLQRRLRACGAHIDDIRYCPDHPEGTVSPFNRKSCHRKPEAGMFLDLMAAWPVIVEESLGIGDKQSDVAAAEAAGIRGILYGSGDLNALLNESLPSASDV